MLYFPHPLEADEDGLLAVGGDLNSARLILAYTFGIFPWYNESESPILWWFTHPRCVLYPTHLKVAKSMNSYFNQQKYRVSYNTHFSDVMMKCSGTQRKGQDGTWINPDMISAYTDLHFRGYAHSVEVWEENELVGGLYGIALGKIFCGESMFSERPNASKFGFISLVKILIEKEFTLIDCQQETSHLMSLGAETISKEIFWSLIKKNMLWDNQKLTLPNNN